MWQAELQQVKAVARPHNLESSAGIHATSPVKGHACFLFAPSDFEIVGGENQACRGRTWYDTCLKHQRSRR